MPLPVTFAGLPQGDNPATLLDLQFNALAGFVIIPCAATGQNIIELEPFFDAPTVTAYSDLAPMFTFAASETCTGNVTMNVAGLGEHPAYKDNGGALVEAGDILQGLVYQAVFLTSLDGGAGGFVVNAGFGGSPITPPGGEMAVIVFVYYSNASFVPPPGMTSCIVEGMGGGGGGGGALSDGVNALCGGGGGSGGYFKVWLTAAQVGSSQNVTIGLGGGPEAQGGNTSFGTLATAQGGFPGLRNDAGTPTGWGNPGSGGGVTLSGGVVGLQIMGSPGMWGQSVLPHPASADVFGGAGGAVFGGGAEGAAMGPTFGGGGDDAINAGAGGGGGASNGASGGGIQIGGNGGHGWVFVTAFT